MAGVYYVYTYHPNTVVLRGEDQTSRLAKAHICNTGNIAFKEFADKNRLSFPTELPPFELIREYTRTCSTIVCLFNDADSKWVTIRNGRRTDHASKNAAYTDNGLPAPAKNIANVNVAYI